MTFSDILFIGVGLSMDAFAVSMCQGVSMQKLLIKNALLIALFFGGFQALMPLLGFALGSTFASFITIGPWIACALLLILGIKMLVDGIHDQEAKAPSGAATIGKLFMLAVATSIDAFAVGVTFSMQEGIVWLHGGTSIFFAVFMIGAITFALSLLGVRIGNRFGLKYHKAATIAGGIVLMTIGLKIALETLGILPSFLQCGKIESALAAPHILWL